MPLQRRERMILYIVHSVGDTSWLAHRIYRPELWRCWYGGADDDDDDDDDDDGDDGDVDDDAGDDEDSGDIHDTIVLHIDIDKNKEIFLGYF